MSPQPLYRILVVEDEQDLANLLQIHLVTVPASVEVCSDGLEAFAILQARLPDLLVLDLNLPGMGGLDICRSIREQGADLPILMLTARASELDRVVGLEFGADDYLVKPFGVLELVARVRALLRRVVRLNPAMPNDDSNESTGSPNESADSTRPLSVFRAPLASQSSSNNSPLITDGSDHAVAQVLGKARSETTEPSNRQPDRIDIGELTIDRGRRTVSFHREVVNLKPREFDLLWFFASRPGRVFTRAELLAGVWGYAHEGYNHTVNTHINRLRSKLGDDRAAPTVIHTVWGVGYRFDPSPKRPHS